MEMVVPVGAQTGDIVTFTAPNGRNCEVPIPWGKQGGDMFIVHVIDKDEDENEESERLLKAHRRLLEAHRRHLQEEEKDKQEEHEEMSVLRAQLSNGEKEKMEKDKKKE